jgi:oligopeptide/dipeptide ABC transporter ATP-binding protein
MGTAALGGPILVASDLSKRFAGRRSAGDVARLRSAPRLTALDRVSIELWPGRTLGVVGESGSGKTTLARCLVRLIEPDSGSVMFDGRDVLAARGEDLAAIRRSVQLVYQDPYSSLDPRVSVRDTIAEPARVHHLVDRSGADALVDRMLDLVGLPTTVAKRLPRDLSGGQRQRVAIARALGLRPRVLIADEAVSALDVSIQAQILNLLDQLRAELDLAILFIAHQLGVIAHLADTVAVMYLGRIVEHGPVADLFLTPRHPYTAALLAANPGLRPRAGRPPSLSGEIPSPYAIPPGCRFSSRCRFVEDRCRATEPALVEVDAGRVVRCHVLPPLVGVRSQAEPARGASSGIQSGQGG